uniref:myosin-binding protein 1-like n=1 Tax=Erigeron canadensis TaxID=72917 RepID=UPI001CB96980|nr:myosin-binding protein 1-like [Erigeron canadensis]
MAATNEFMHHLSMACCEWFLMFLMFMDGALGFIASKFAHRCELQKPCMFCSRIDHVFGEKPGSFLNLFCDKHRAEVSCLISCELHDKLADVKEMCDACFMSAMKQKQIMEGKLGYPKGYLNKNFVRVPSSMGTCSCCKKQWKPKPRGGVKLGVSKVTMKPPMPRVGARGRGQYRRRNDFRRVRGRISGTSTPCLVENSIGMDVNADLDMDALSDSGCPNVGFNSFYDFDSESDSEDSFFEVDCGATECLMDDSWVINKMGIQNQDHVRPEKFHSFSNPEFSLPNGTNNETDTSPLSLTSTGSIGHDAKENGHLEVSKETRVPNQNIHTINDCQVSTSSDKHEGFESPRSTGLSEIEGESYVEKLKRQVEHDQEQLRLLHKELEEERNAAAIAADETMAMITRLQEEKAALHMEASQYLRMMDEQAEYDMEALDKANDLIAEKEKEIQDMEAELEYFRNRYEDELFMGNATDTSKENHMENGIIDVTSSDSKSTKELKSTAISHPDLGLEDEKEYILHSLSELEKKFHQASNGNIANNGFSRHDEIDVGTLENEISDLNERLKAFEADRQFLEHACNMLQSNGGLEFIQEIAHHLHDLRKDRFDRRCQSVT